MKNALYRKYVRSTSSLLSILIYICVILLRRDKASLEMPVSRCASMTLLQVAHFRSQDGVALAQISKTRCNNVTMGHDRSEATARVVLIRNDELVQMCG